MLTGSRLSPSEGIEPLASTNLNGQSQGVAAVCRVKGEARFAFVPEYLMAPYLLTDEPPFSNPAQPQLDRVGVAVLMSLLRLLR